MRTCRYYRRVSPFSCLAPWVAVIPVIQEHINPGCCTLHGVARVVVYEHGSPYIPTHHRVLSRLNSLPSTDRTGMCSTLHKRG